MELGNKYLVSCILHMYRILCPPATAFHHADESDAVGGRSEVQDLSREGLFDIHQDHPRSATSPWLLQDTQGVHFG